jgi:hypothetical protein
MPLVQGPFSLPPRFAAKPEEIDFIPHWKKLLSRTINRKFKPTNPWYDVPPPVICAVGK